MRVAGNELAKLLGLAERSFGRGDAGIYEDESSHRGETLGDHRKQRAGSRMSDQGDVSRRRTTRGTLDESGPVRRRPAHKRRQVGDDAVDKGGRFPPTGRAQQRAVDADQLHRGIFAQSATPQVRPAGGCASFK